MSLWWELKSLALRRIASFRVGRPPAEQAPDLKALHNSLPDPCFLLALTMKCSTYCSACWPWSREIQGRWRETGRRNSVMQAVLMDSLLFSPPHCPTSPAPGLGPVCRSVCQLHMTPSTLVSGKPLSGHLLHSPKLCGQANLPLVSKPGFLHVKCGENIKFSLQVSQQDSVKSERVFWAINCYRNVIL